MAETLVLAELSIDATGVVTGVAVTKDALGQAGAATNKFAASVKATHDPTRILTDRLFSLRHAAIALFGGATLAGGILALKNMFQEAAHGAPAFKELSASLEAINHSLTETIAKAPAFNAVLHGLSETALVTAAALKAAVISWVAPTQDPFATFRETLDKWRDEQANIMAGAAGIAGTPFKMPESFVRPFGAQGAPDDWKALSENLDRFSPFADKAAESTQRLHDAMMGIKTLDVGGEFANTFARAGVTVIAFKDSLPTLMDALSETGGAFDQLKDAAGAAFGAILAGEHIDLRAFVKQVLTAIAVQASVKAVWELAEGIAASARYAASYGADVAAAAAAKLHYAAARQYIAVAALAGAGARLAGSGESGGGGGRSGTSGFGNQEAPPPARNYYVTVNGVVGNEVQVARTIEDWLRKIEKSNS